MSFLNTLFASGHGSLRIAIGRCGLDIRERPIGRVLLALLFSKARFGGLDIVGISQTRRFCGAISHALQIRKMLKYLRTGKRTVSGLCKCGYGQNQSDRKQDD